MLEYGATGDGSTDDTTSIQAALNAASASVGGTVYFPTPPNYYKVTQLTLFQVQQLHLVGDMGAEPDPVLKCIVGSGASVFDIQQCNNLVWKNLRIQGTGANTGFDVHGGGWVNNHWILDNMDFCTLGTALQIGRCSTENGGSVVTYAYSWDVRNMAFIDVVKAFVIDAQAFDFLKMTNVTIYDDTDVCEIFLEGMTGMEPTIIMDQVGGRLGSSCTHAIKLSSGRVNLRNCHWEQGQATDDWLFLYCINATMTEPSVLQNVFVDTQDGGGDSISWGGAEGLIILGGEYKGNIRLRQPMMCVAIGVQDLDGGFASFVGSTHGLVEMRQDPGGTLPNDGYVIARHLRADRYLQLADGVAAPATIAGYGIIYIDTADGDLKIRYGDGTIKTIVVDT